MSCRVFHFVCFVLRPQPIYTDRHAMQWTKRQRQLEDRKVYPNAAGQRTAQETCLWGVFTSALASRP